MNAQPAIIQVPLSQLRLSPRNARTTGGHDIEGLAASIAAHSLLQNLTVMPGANDSAFEVVAGGRRLAAMQLLRDRGQLDADFSVPCKVITDDGVALEASTAENTLREAMHPADQFDAFKGMIEAKKPIPDVAAHFGVTELYVKQRLKLGNVSPKLVKIYREGGMSLEQLQALAVTDDHKAQEKAWFGPKFDHLKHPQNLRRSLTDQEVRSDSQLARFVGLDVYERAGGPVRRDLFSALGEAFLGDKGLLDKLAMDKLEAIARRERDAGWSWVETHIGLDYDKLSAYPHLGVTPKRRKPEESDKALIEKTNARIAEISKVLESDDDEDDSDLDQDAVDALWDERDHLVSELQRLKAGEDVWPAEAMASAGVVVNLGHGGLVIERGRLKPGQKSGAGGKVAAAGKAAPNKAPAKKVLSQDMVLRLEMHRAAATREHIAARPEAALQLLLAHLLTKLLTDSYSESVLDIAPTNQHKNARQQIETKFSDLGKAPARSALDLRVAQWKKDGLPTKASDLVAWLAKLAQPKQLELLALATALTLNTNAGARGAALAERFDVDMAKWWSPAPETFYSLVPKALLAEAVTDVAGKTAGDSLLALKKDGAMAEASKKLASTGWLPKPLRGAKYSVGAAKAKAPAKKAATKKPAEPKPAKKPAKKAAAKKAKKAS